MAFSRRCISQKCWCRSTAVAVAVAFAVAAAVTGSTHTYVTYYVYHIRVLNAFLLILSCKRTGTCMHGKMPWAVSLLPNWKLHAHKINLQKGRRKAEKRKLTVTNSSLCSRQWLPACLACLVCWVLHNLCLAASQTLCGSVDRAAVRNSHINLMRQQAKKCQRENECVCAMCVCVSAVSELMPDNKQNIKTALSARRIMQAAPSTTRQSQSMLPPPPRQHRVTPYNPYKIS